ncbi:MoxR family ATPase [Lentzea sp. NPDC042327]|uniref:MoxR family ATPase n=1 Tax=Lentzea sp. NPDC042327 TaxID=3154801 RepID=UPI0033D73DD8
MSTGTDTTQVETDGKRYVRPPGLDLAVRVATATSRPLLLFGAPGSGKSSLAKNIAYRDDLRYYEHVVTARTSARDLLWSFDSVRRLGDAQLKVRDWRDDDYVTPGVLWWAFDRASALTFKRAKEPHPSWNTGERRRPGAVVLIDEIDKADPDVPNSLLVPLADRLFTVTDLSEAREVREVADPRCLIVITSNQERELPPAFVRRCVVHELEPHDEPTLRKIAESHVGRDRRYPLDHLIRKLQDARKQARADQRRQPSTAEFIDAIRACLGEGIESTTHLDLDPILKMIFEKDAGTGAAPGWSP